MSEVGPLGGPDEAMRVLREALALYRSMPQLRQ
jgi:hypothetical protein